MIKKRNMIKSLAEKVIASGANVVLCQKGIDDLAQYFLAKAGILAVRRVKQSDLERFAKATGAKIIFDLDDLDSTKLGQAGKVEERHHPDKALYITGIKAATILVSGGTDHVAEEARRAVGTMLLEIYSQ